MVPFPFALWSLLPANTGRLPSVFSLFPKLAPCCTDSAISVRKPASFGAPNQWVLSTSASPPVLVDRSKLPSREDFALFRFPSNRTVIGYGPLPPHATSS